MIAIDFSGEINFDLLSQQLSANFPGPQAGITWDQGAGIIYVYEATESDRAECEAIIAAHDPTQRTQAQQTKMIRAGDVDTLYTELADSPNVYQLLWGDIPTTFTDDDTQALARLVRYIFNELNIPMPEWTLNARS